MVSLQVSTATCGWRGGRGLPQRFCSKVTIPLCDSEQLLLPVQQPAGAPEAKGEPPKEPAEVGGLGGRRAPGRVWCEFHGVGRARWGSAWCHWEPLWRREASRTGEGPGQEGFEAPGGCEHLSLGRGRSWGATEVPSAAGRSWGVKGGWEAVRRGAAQDPVTGDSPLPQD